LNHTQKEIAMLADMQGGEYQQYLAKRLDDVMKSMVVCQSSEVLRQLQGQAWMLMELAGNMDEAESIRCGRGSQTPIASKDRF